ncbi:MAG: phospho-N-acetylmuramoyl-pentapeptide-transferase [Streptococcaceae bacterium]|jgi:phospho-N-acetylmuramoyl-pentapeptide-transferase|nr:phospho-N-acetylmuramoyl-pentapeptide-transferase [Streptococcaceae bacterium]
MLEKYILPFVVSFLLVVGIMPQFIKYFQMKKLGQTTLKDVKQHAKKLGTPTMGGLVFLVSAFFSALLSAVYFNLFTLNFIALLFILLLYGFLGFLDDFLKVFCKQNEGLKPKQKFLGQIFGSIVFFFILLYENFPLKLNLFDLDNINLGWFYLAFVIFWLVGFSNAVNLTDGIDGLVSILVSISLASYGVIAWRQKQIDVLMLIFSLIGALLGFFIFNKKPAKIFMGDAGSLALGAILAAISIQLHKEWTLLVIGIVYVFETASVILQVLYFKLTGGKRIFRMTPIHHHFELGGFSGYGKAWSEWQVDFLFWLVGLLGAVSTLCYLL